MELNNNKYIFLPKEEYDALFTKIDDLEKFNNEELEKLKSGEKIIIENIYYDRIFYGKNEALSILKKELDYEHTKIIEDLKKEYEDKLLKKDREIEGLKNKFFKLPLIQIIFPSKKMFNNGK